MYKVKGCCIMSRYAYYLYQFITTMQQHALRTAMTLYRDGTLDLETAARTAGIHRDRLENAVARTGLSPLRDERDRVLLKAD